MKAGALVLATLLALAACHILRSRVADVTYPKEIQASEAFAHVSGVVEGLAKEQGLQPTKCASDLSEPCRAFGDVIVIEVYGAGDRVRVRISDLSPITYIGSYMRHIEARLRERGKVYKLENIRDL